MNQLKIVEEIKSNLKQRSASQKDEVAVMQGMLNDKDYAVGVYSKEGKIGEYSPYEDSRKMVSSILTETTGISGKEAGSLAGEFEFTKSEATTMVNISKEYVNTYLQTGRKLPLGGRENSDIALMAKDIKEAEKKFPGSIGNKDGEMKTAVIPAHGSIKVIAPCPSWLK